MNPKQLIVLFFVAGLMSCGPKPEELELPVETMVSILADVHIAEGALLSIKPAQKDSLRDLYYNQIYEIHGVSAEVFERDIKILKLNPKMMEKVYEIVLEELNLKEAELQGEQAKTKK